MATLVLSAVGASLGGMVGGGAFGLSSVVIGRAIGATVGRLVDQRLMGGGSDVVETARMDRLRIMGAREGAPVARVFGRMRVAGNVIWASDFEEHVAVSGGGGKGAPKGPKIKSFTYSVSLAIGLCEGQIAGVGRVWADGAEIAPSDLNMRVYKGDESQSPDPVMEAVEGAGSVPSYRGLAYVVLEDFDLSQFGNRVPQLSFEIIRPAQMNPEGGIAETTRAVALMPGSGESALYYEPVFSKNDSGLEVGVNVNSRRAKADFDIALAGLRQELPKCEAVSLVVSWFGNDLRAGHCDVEPKVENGGSAPFSLGSFPLGGSRNADWSVSGAGRSDVKTVALVDERPVYGGTPSDASVISAIRAAQNADQAVMFYPFILMEILSGNLLPDPWKGEDGQPALPWRGRITSDVAPGLPESTDRTAALRAEIEAFLGDAAVGDFAVSGDQISYSGPSGWGYRRFILHYAHLCKAAGGIEAFCIGSELRSLTQLRDEVGAFPFVSALKTLAEEVRGILGTDTKIGYAADWSEYFGYHPQDGSGDILFHLDPLWSDPAVDFIGIDNYMPISDWRDGDDHQDLEHASRIYDLEYLQNNITAGEGYDWYYEDDQAREFQRRTPITDGAHDEPWIYRYKDLVGWWSNPHHERVGGIRAELPTDWEPQSKPFWLTELGCAAIDKGTNQPNKFLDPKSSESSVPHFSSGHRDDYIQMQYLRAYNAHFSDEMRNPNSEVYGAAMVEQSRMFAWAWDTRPWPEFPNNLELWSDGENHIRGHWLTGRSAGQRLSDVVRDICVGSGVANVDTSQLSGIVHGYSLPEVETGRASLQQLMLAYGFDAVEDRGTIVFVSREHPNTISINQEQMVLPADDDAVFQQIRAADAETTGQVRVSYCEAEGGFEDRVAEARFPGDNQDDLTQTELSLSLTSAEARAVAERWLSEARIARESVRFALPPSCRDIRAGMLVDLGIAHAPRATYRVDRIEDAGARLVEAVRTERQVYQPSEAAIELPGVRRFSAPVKIATQFMDLPLLRGAEVPHAPHVASTAKPWPGGAAVFESSEDSGYRLNEIVEAPATMGVTMTVLPEATPGLWQRGAVLRIKLATGTLSSASESEVLNGRNVAALGDGSSGVWEVFQFTNAVLVGPDTYELSRLLRGQVGSDGLIPESWPAGSRFVLLDQALTQLNLEPAMRRLARHYRIGPAQRPVDDPSYQHFFEAFEGIGLKPYAPAHLRLRASGAGMAVSWVRRTRIDGDNWNSLDVPLGEETEAYLVRVVVGEMVVREVTVALPEWIYSDADRAVDGVTGAFSIAVAQISNRFGPGYFSKVEING